MIEVRRETPADVEAVRAVLEAAFPTKAEADLVDALRRAGDVAVSVVAVEHGAILGHAMLSRMFSPFPAVALAPVAAVPERHGCGIGTRLVERALAMARDDGWVAAFVLGAPSFYDRFGFSADLASGFQSPYAGSHFMAAALAGALPVRSGRVDHAPAFAALG